MAELTDTTLVQRPFSSTTGVSQYQAVSVLDFVVAKDDEGRA